MSNNVDSIFYWTILGVTATIGKISGVFAMVTNALPEVTLPVHEVKYLPQLEDALPAFIIAGGCALISAIINKLFGLLWSKLLTTIKKSNGKK